MRAGPVHGGVRVHAPTLLLAALSPNARTRLPSRWAGMLHAPYAPLAQMLTRAAPLRAGARVELLGRQAMQPTHSPLLVSGGSVKCRLKTGALDTVVLDTHRCVRVWVLCVSMCVGMGVRVGARGCLRVCMCVWGA